MKVHILRSNRDCPMDNGKGAWAVITCFECTTSVLTALFTIFREKLGSVTDKKNSHKILVTEFKVCIRLMLFSNFSLSSIWLGGRDNISNSI